MLRHGPPHQIRLKHFVWEYQVGLRINLARHEPFIDEDLMPYFEYRPPKEFDFTPFERRKKSLVNVLSGFLSKSESVFCEAVDAMDEIVERGVASPVLVGYQLSSILSACHAFDQGDTPAVSWIAGERQDLIDRIGRHGIWAAQPLPLLELESKGSFLVQAADLAAGIAQAIWNRDSLPHLTAAFDYVTYNGKRLSESEAGTIEADLRKRKGWLRRPENFSGPSCE